MGSARLQLLLLASFWGSIAFAGPSGPQPQESASKVGISWVLFDDRADFRQAPQVVRDFAVGSPALGAQLSIDPSRVLQIPLASPLSRSGKSELHSFETYLRLALNKLHDQTEPELYVFISSHGSTTGIERQGTNDIKFEQMIQTLLGQVDRAKVKDLRIRFFYSGCFSASINPVFEKLIQSRAGLKYRIDVLTSAPPELESHGNLFWDSLSETAKLLDQIHADLGEHPLTGPARTDEIIKMANAIGAGFHNQENDRPQLWSSYQDVHSDPQLKNLLEVLGQTDVPRVESIALGRLERSSRAEAIRPYLNSPIAGLKRGAQIGLMRLDPSFRLSDEEYLAFLRNSNPALRVAAARGLDATRNPEAVNTALRGLRDTDTYSILANRITDLDLRGEEWGEIVRKSASLISPIYSDPTDRLRAKMFQYFIKDPRPSQATVEALFTYFHDPVVSLKGMIEIYKDPVRYPDGLNGLFSNIEKILRQPDSRGYLKESLMQQLLQISDPVEARILSQSLLRKISNREIPEVLQAINQSLEKNASLFENENYARSILESKLRLLEELHVSDPEINKTLGKILELEITPGAREKVTAFLEHSKAPVSAPAEKQRLHERLLNCVLGWINNS
jgi:hypothetical protein